MPDLASLLAALCSGDDQRAETAAIQFAPWGQPAIDELARVVERESSDERWWAVRSLAEFEQGAASQILIAALKDKDKTVQQCAALALRKKPHPEAVSDLATLLNDSDHLLVHLAADALAAIGKAATPALLDIIHDGGSLARVEAVRALGQYQDDKSIATLFQLLDDQSMLIDYWATEALQNMGIGMCFFQPDQ